MEMMMMMMMMKNLSLMLLLFALSLIPLKAHNEYPSISNKQIPIGAIVDMKSLVGGTVHSCIDMAISDFYAVNSHYRTRIVLHTRDSGGEPLRALSASLDLLENIEVQAIIGSETLLEAKLFAMLGDKAKVPILSFVANPSSSTEYPYFVRITQDEKTQFEGISNLVESFKWRDVILIYEDTDYGRETTPYLLDSFQEKNIHVSYKSVISPNSKDDGQVIEELYKLKNMYAKVFLVHMSPSLSSIIFLNAKRLGMMSEGYAWIVSDKTMNLLHYMDSEAIESMQGALGFKSYIPPSNEVRNLTLRWRKEYYTKDPSTEVRELNVLSIQAYDAVWALAKAVEEAGVEIPLAGKQASVPNLSPLLNQILKVRFIGLGGEFRLISRSLLPKEFEIVNVIGKGKGKGERRVGIWTPVDGISRVIKCQSYKSGLEAIIWPGGSTTTPKRSMMGIVSKKLGIGVPFNRGFSDLVNLRVDETTNATIVTGFCIDVFSAAIEGLQYEVPYEFIPFLRPNGHSAGSQNDLIDQVIFRKFDAVVGDTTITANRSLYVDFTLPYTDLGVGMVSRIGNKNMWIFLEPLDVDLWITIVGFLILIGFVIWVIEHPINEEFQGSPAQQVRTTLWFSFSTLLFAHRQKLQSNLSRFVTTVWILVVLILTSCYTATLSLLLTVQQIRLASNDFIGYHDNNLLRGAIVRNLNFKDNRLKPYSSPEEYADALTRGSKNGGVGAIIDEIPYIKIFLGKYPGDYAMIASEPTTNGFGFVFPKGSVMATDMSREIARLREDGTLMRLENKWFNKEQPLLSQQQQDSSTKPKTLNLANFSGLFFVSGLSSASALLIFLIYFFKAKLQLFNFYIFEVLAKGRLAFMITHIFSKNVSEIELINRR